MIGDRQPDEYAIGAWPQYDDDVGEPPLIAYATDKDLSNALGDIAYLVRRWEANDWPDDVVDPPGVVGFEIVVSRPGFANPNTSY